MAVLIQMTSQSWLFIQGLNDKFDASTELLSMEVMKGTSGEGLYQTLSENLGRHTVSVEQVNQCDDS
jgi:hypothetical protein